MGGRVGHARVTAATSVGAMVQIVPGTPAGMSTEPPVLLSDKTKMVSSIASAHRRSSRRPTWIIRNPISSAEAPTTDRIRPIGNAMPAMGTVVW